MNILFESKDTSRPIILEEYYRYILLKSPASILRYILAGLAAAFALFDLILNSVTGTLDMSTTLLMYLILCYSVCLGISRMLSFKNVKKTLAYRDTEIMRVETVAGVTDEGIFASSELGASCSAPFSSIKFVYSGETAIFIQSKGDLLYIFDKAGFIVGTADEMIGFLKSKGISVKG